MNDKRRRRPKKKSLETQECTPCRDRASILQPQSQQKKRNPKRCVIIHNFESIHSLYVLGLSPSSTFSDVRYHAESICTHCVGQDLRMVALSRNSNACPIILAYLIVCSIQLDIKTNQKRKNKLVRLIYVVGDKFQRQCKRCFKLNTDW